MYVENLDCNFGQAVQTWNKWVWVGSNKELIGFWKLQDHIINALHGGKMFHFIVQI